MAPLRTSFAIFDEAGGNGRAACQINASHRLSAISARARAFAAFYRHHAPAPNEHGAQLSILVHEHPKELFKKLEAGGVKSDFREPNVIRVAPTPLYNTFHEVWRFAQILSAHH